MILRSDSETCHPHSPPTQPRRQQLDALLLARPARVLRLLVDGHSTLRIPGEVEERAKAMLGAFGSTRESDAWSLSTRGT